MKVKAVLAVAAVASSTAILVPAGLLLTAGAELIDLDDAYAYAFFNLAWAAGFTVGAVAGGGVAAATGDTVPYLVVAGLFALTAVRAMAPSEAPATVPP